MLSIPHVPLAKPHNPKVGEEKDRVDCLIPSVPWTRQTCASTGYCGTAGSAMEIQDALNSIFGQTTRKARLVSSF